MIIIYSLKWNYWFKWPIYICHQFFFKNDPKLNIKYKIPLVYCLFPRTFHLTQPPQMLRFFFYGDSFFPQMNHYCPLVGLIYTFHNINVNSITLLNKCTHLFPDRDPNFMDNFIHCTNHAILFIKKIFEGLSNNKVIH
jgi:hypothetical protein